MAGNLWTQEEIEFLKENYHEYGATYCSENLNRTVSSTTQKANRLGLKSKISLRNSVWTEEEDNVLRTYYFDKGANECIKYLVGRTKSSINHRAMALNISCPLRGTPRWSHSDYEMALLERDIDFYPIEDYTGFDVKIKHECLREHVWSARPSAILRGTGCPVCASHGFDPSKPAILYYIKIETYLEKYYKIGITNRSIKDRFSLDTDKTITSLLEEQFSIGQHAKDKEKQILCKFSEFRINMGNFLKSGGNTEIFEIDILNLDN